MYSIIIPSCKNYEELMLHTELIRCKDTERLYTYIPTGFQASASVNRNYGLTQALALQNEIIIMIDDDIGGFFPGWQDALTAPLREDSNALISSARLITPDGFLSPMMGADNKLDKKRSIAEKAILSAAIAFRKKDIEAYPKLHFCMNMLGSGWEDTLFCRMFTKYFPSGKFIVANDCRLIHYHEMKNQNQHFEYNQRVYVKECQKEGIHA